ncbi:MAG: DUF1874 domain-containing protein [Elusimicrobia bacterium]|nr:DUF1874 domain-containing protein [Elusimicrobiota bacterium]
MKLLSSFSFSMVNEYPIEILAQEVSRNRVKAMLKRKEVEPSIGHPSLAAVFSGVFGMKIESERVKIKLKKGEKALIAQLFRANRLPEGRILTIEDIKKIKIKFLLIEIR